MEPLTTWICDTCGDAIEDATKGLVVWNSDESLRKDGFKIVHKGKHCDLDRRMQSLEVAHFVGQKGQASLTSWLSYGPIKNHGNSARILDMDAYVDLFRRLQTPWYEEARPYFQSEAIQEVWGDSNEGFPYGPDSLQQIAEAGRAAD
ncbi:hypothetical protein RCH16_003623 [Cryobacterium sp. MP_M5]|uniref:hypothetical protein n=1 Tax=unclassified Cryobacterium TaxID=2649013 RepID=UPI0018C8E34C|nr:MULTISPECIES: hypothetical protein [unclassified Cryobacterium]MBG6060148.1 hypothetical protein [Cryobacterium sp. MP_M3]MEC5178584.1 hypothetical protein [Cryobacterium sp. MP_M5]